MYMVFITEQFLEVATGSCPNSTLCHSCGFYYQQSVVKRFPIDGVV